jgi:hypothetical protein
MQSGIIKLNMGKYIVQQGSKDVLTSAGSEFEPIGDENMEKQESINKSLEVSRI